MRTWRLGPFSLALALALAAGRATGQCDPYRGVEDGDPQANAHHGWSAAADGEYVALGTPGQTMSGLVNAGEVCAYRGFPVDNWDIASYMRALDPAAGAQFGTSVALGAAHTWAAVGAPGLGGGAVYLFQRDPASWPWVQSVKLAPAFTPGDRFGQAVAMNRDGTVLAAGAPHRDIGATPQAGSVLVYTRSGNTWTYEAALYQDDPNLRHGGDEFGDSVGADGERVVIGAPWADPFGLTNAGYAEVWVRSAGPTWTLEALISPVDAQPYDFFGWSVAMAGDLIAVGAPGADVNGISSTGAVYVYRRHDGLGWVLETKVVPSDPTSNAGFGAAVGISQQELVATTQGANPAAYVFRTGNAWYQDGRYPDPEPATSNGYGTAVAVDGTTAVVTSPWLDRGPVWTAAGAGYVITPPGPESDSFGSAQEVGAGQYQGCTTFCTLDGATTCGTGAPQGPDVYYRYRAPATGTVVMDTQGSDFDTILSVHVVTQLSGTANNTIVCNDDFAAPERWSRVSLPVIAGNLYMVRISGYNGASGAFTLNIGGVNACYANCDGSTVAPVLSINDFICFQGRFAAGDSYANCDGSTTPPVLSINDFICFQNRFAAGCP